MKNDNLGGLRYLVFNEIFMLLHILIVKIIAGDFPAIQIVFIRCLASSIILLPLFITQKRLSEMNQDLGAECAARGIHYLGNYYQLFHDFTNPIGTGQHHRIPAPGSGICNCMVFPLANSKAGIAGG